MNANVMAPNPRVARKAPGKSNPRLSSFRLSGTRRQVIQTTATAIGTLIRNAQRQEMCSTIQPPRTGPNAAVIDVKPDQVPMARPRSLSGNEALINARLPGTSNAAPTPCTLRAAISHPIDGASPQPADAMANNATPTRKILARPYRSPSEPPKSSKDESMRAYDSTTH